MKTDILFLKPYLEQKIWGGDHLEDFNYNLNGKCIGEAWIVSALENKSSVVINQEAKEKTLFEFYKHHPDFFNYHAGEYPTLTKIIDACQDLSIQVHPNDQYALARHHQLGKTECWYILDAKPNAEIVYGLKTTDNTELVSAIKNNNLEALMNVVPVKKGDLFFVPAGLVHAIKAGVLIYELQQSSDITYRLYDYNRLENGKLRELHIEDALKVIDYRTVKTPSSEEFLIDCKYFKLKKMEVNNSLQDLFIPEAMWLEVTVIDGFGKVDRHPIKKGDVFLLRHNCVAKLEGICTLLVGYVTQ